MLNYVDGDVTKPIKYPCAILHVVNTVNLFGAGVALAIAQRYPTAKQDYHQAYKNGQITLGNVVWSLPLTQDDKPDPKLVIGHMVAQKGVRNRNNLIPFKLSALADCLQTVNNDLSIAKQDYSIHLPRIGIGLGGFDPKNWYQIEDLIKNKLADFEIFVYNWR
jgi:O-acetyl-ADP-ribose deacetylase (regulator of RNase III)